MKRASDRPTMPLIMPHMCPYRPGAIYSTPGEPQRPLCVKTSVSVSLFVSTGGSIIDVFIWVGVISFFLLKNAYHEPYAHQRHPNPTPG